MSTSSPKEQTVPSGAWAKKFREPSISSSSTSSISSKTRVVTSATTSVSSNTVIINRIVAPSSSTPSSTSTVPTSNGENSLSMVSENGPASGSQTAMLTLVWGHAPPPPFAPPLPSHPTANATTSPTISTANIFIRLILHLLN